MDFKACSECGVSMDIADVRDAVYCGACARYTLAPSTKPGAGAAVTREHREAAACAMLEAGARVLRWINTSDVFQPFNDDLIRMAQAIAEAELRGQRSRDEEVERLKRELEFAKTNRQTLADDMARLAIGEAVRLDISDRVRHRIDLLRQRIVELEAAAVTDEQLEADLELLRTMALEWSGHGEHEWLAINRIEAALARGDK